MTSILLHDHLMFSLSGGYALGISYRSFLKTNLFYYEKEINNTVVQLKICRSKSMVLFICLWCNDPFSILISGSWLFKHELKFNFDQRQWIMKRYYNFEKKYCS